MNIIEKKIQNNILDETNSNDNDIGETVVESVLIKETVITPNDRLKRGPSCCK